MTLLERDEKENGAKKKEEGEQLSLGEAKPLQLTPDKKSKPAQKDGPLVIEPKKLSKISSKGTVEQKEDKKENKEKMFIPPRATEAKLEIPVETEDKGSPFFKFLFIFSLVLIAVGAGLLLLPILNISVPTFLAPAIDFVNKLL